MAHPMKADCHSASQNKARLITGNKGGGHAFEGESHVRKYGGGHGDKYWSGARQTHAHRDVSVPGVKSKQHFAKGGRAKHKSKGDVNIAITPHPPAPPPPQHMPIPPMGGMPPPGGGAPPPGGPPPGAPPMPPPNMPGMQGGAGGQMPPGLLSALGGSGLGGLGGGGRGFKKGGRASGVASEFYKGNAHGIKNGRGVGSEGKNVSGIMPGSKDHWQKRAAKHTLYAMGGIVKVDPEFKAGAQTGVGRLQKPKIYGGSKG